MTETPNYDGEFDAIVVGAGLAGSTAALTMARADLDVIVLERGPSPGSKNVFGGVLFTPTLRELVDLDDAPLERYIAEKRYSVLSEDDETAVSMRPGAWREEPHNDSYTVLRGDFDEWLADQAVEAGATLLTETTVTDLRRGDRGHVVGVETDRPDGTLRAPVVVVAEGANSLVSEAGDLKETPGAENVAVSVKEVFKYDRETIEERFRVSGDAGVAYNYFGEGAVGAGFGGGFIYTNRDTVSVGVAYTIEDAVEQDAPPEEVLNQFKQHPAVAPLLRGGRLVEYSAHAIPEGGLDAMPDLVHDGAVVAGDAAGLVLNNGVHLEGTNMAVESGYHAGRAAADAIEQGRTDADALADYRESLTDSFVVQNLRHYDWFQDQVAADQEFLFEELPSALADAEAEYFRMDREPKAEHASQAKQRLLEATGGWLGAAKYAWKYRKMLS
ncbi:MAG: FAD-dependent oxidoreductase [Halobacteriaceae archaeon]